MSLDGDWIRDSDDHFWTLGCCKVCSLPEKKKGCWCTLVRCRECLWYEGKTIENEEYDNLTYIKGKCIFPNSNFCFPSGSSESIINKTEKAFLIRYSDYPSFWIPKEACTIEDDDDFEYITIKGWFLVIKANEYEKNNNKSDKDELLANLYYEISQEFMS